MSICFITGYGKRIRAENGLIAIDTPPGENAPPSKTIVTPADLSLVVIAGDHLLTTGAIRILLENDAELALLDRYGAPVGFLLPGKKSPVIEHAERQRNLSEKIKLAIARAIVGQALREQDRSAPQHS